MKTRIAYHFSGG